MEDIPPGETPNQLQVHVITVDDDQNSANCSIIIPFTLNSNGMMFICLNGMMFICLNENTCGPSLMHHRRYKTIISAKNDLGTANSTGKIGFGKSLHYVL